MESENLEEQVDNYLLNRMSEEERAQFEQELSANEALQQQVEEQRSLIDGIRLSQRESLKSFLQEKEEVSFTEKKRSSYRWVGIAAAVAALLVPTYFLFLSGPESTRLTALDLSEYTTPYPNYGIVITRDAEIPKRGDSLALYYYENQEYKKTIQLLENPDQFEQPEILNFYKGLSYFMLEKYSEAKPLLSNLKSDANYWNAAEWYLILIQLKENDMDQKAWKDLDELANDNGHEFQAKAKELLKQRPVFE